MAAYSDKNFGFSGATIFHFWCDVPQILNPSIYLSGVLWSFGDGNTSQELLPKHTYTKEGNYEVTVTLFTTNSNLQITEEYESFTTNIKVSNFLQKSIYFDNVPPPTPTNQINSYPFRVKYTSESTNQHSVVVSVKDKRATFSNNEIGLNPQYSQWSVLDSNFNLTNSIKGTQDLIYISAYGSDISNASSGFSVGVSGYADFYIVNENSNIHESLSIEEISTLIEVTLIETEDILFKNSDTSATIPHIFTWNVPTKLNITHDFYDKISYHNWVEVPHPICITTGYENLNQPLLYKKSFDHNLIYNTQFEENSIYVDVNIGNENQTLSTEFSSPLKFNTNNSINSQNKEFFVGSCESTFIVDSSSSEDVIISASATFPLPETTTIGNHINPTLFLSNPKAGILNKLQILFSENNSYFNNKIIPVPSLNLESEYGNLHDIKQIAALPAPHYTAWCSDNYSGKIYLTDNNGKILKYINLKGFLVPSDETEPVYEENDTFSNQIILDLDLNLWVSLNNTNILAQFDLNGECIRTYKFEEEDIVLNFNISSSNVIWALVKDSNDILKMYEIEILSQELNVLNIYSDDIFLYNFIETAGDVMATCHTSSTNINESVIEKWSLMGDESIAQNFTAPGIVTDLGLDLNYNIWYVIKNGTVARRDSNNNLKYIILESSLQEPLPLNLTNIILDYRNVAYVVDSANNEIYIIQDDLGNNSNLKLISSYIVNPSLFENKSSPPGPETEYVSSLIGFGDVNSFKWSNKFADQKDSLYSASDLTLYGESAPIKFIDKTKIPKIKKINESYSFVENFKNLGLIPTLTNSGLLHDYFNTCLVFNTNYNFQNYLNTDSFIYEKISNFVLNNSDLESCSYTKLKDYSSLIGYYLKTDYLNIPMAIERLIDLCSIDNHKLIGKSTSYGLNLNNNYRYGQSNRGNLLDHTYIIDVNTPIILRDTYNNKFSLLTTPDLPGLKYYTLDFLASTLLNLSPKWRENYEFYEYLEDTYTTNPINSIIDWNSEDTSLNISDVKSSNWLKNDGIVESLFSIELHRGLDLLNN